VQFVRLFWRGQLQRDTLLLLAGQTFYKLSGIALLMVLSRRLPAEQIGVFFFASSFAESFLTVASFHLNPVLVRRVAVAPEEASSHLAPLLGFRLLSSGLYLLWVTIAGLVFARTVWGVIVVVALFTLFDNIYFTFGALFIALGKTIYNVSIGVVIQSVFLLLFLFGMWWAPSLEMVVATNFVRSLCLAVAAGYVTHRWLCPLWVSWDKSLIKEGMPFFFLNLFILLRERVDTLLLGFLTNYDTVGYYQLAFRVIFASLFIPMVVNSVLFPRFAAHGLSSDNRRLLFYGISFLFGLGLLGSGIVFFYAVPISALFYGALADTVAPLLRVMALLFPLSFLHPFLSSILQGLYQEARVLRVVIFSVGVSFLAHGTLIPLFGAYGAIYARLLSDAVGIGILGWCLWRLYKQKSPRSRKGTEPSSPATNLD